jgi:dethiobiotin synthetase
MRKIFVTGIGTDVGKTIISAIIAEKLKADYWKPIQAGNLNDTDTKRIKRLISNEKTVFHPESYCFSKAISPHAAAHSDGMKINLSKIKLPVTKKHLVIEGAGGLMVPLNQKSLIIDLISNLKAEVVLVAKNYLGSINHTLLSIDILQTRGMNITGIVFNGLSNDESENFILKYSGLKCLARIKHAPKITPEFIVRNTSNFII